MNWFKISIILKRQFNLHFDLNSTELYIYISVWFTNSYEKREAKSKGEKERYFHLNAEFQRIARRDKKALLSDQCKEIEERNRMGRLEISSRKLEIQREYFMQRWAQ